MNRDPQYQRVAAGGFTLLELMIVLTLIALMLAIAWPSLRRPLDRSEPQEAARQLVEDLGRARFHAIETGRTMVFRYEPGGTRYEIMPADLLDGRGADRDDDSRDDQYGAEDEQGLPARELEIEGMFDNGVTFRDPAAVDEEPFPAGSALSDTLADEMAETEAVEPLIQSEGQETSWSAPILIYPTGRAENASIELAGSKNYSVTITLRGLTGALTIGPPVYTQVPEDLSEMSQEPPDFSGQQPARPSERLGERGGLE